MEATRMMATTNKQSVSLIVHLFETDDDKSSSRVMKKQENAHSFPGFILLLKFFISYFLITDQFFVSNNFQRTGTIFLLLLLWKLILHL
jgi:hypothetical protein